MIPSRVVTNQVVQKNPKSKLVAVDERRLSLIFALRGRMASYIYATMHGEGMVVEALELAVYLRQWLVQHGYCTTAPVRYIA